MQKEISVKKLHALARQKQTLRENVDETIQCRELKSPVNCTVDNLK